MNNNFDFDPNEIILNIMAQARRKAHAKVNDEIEQRVLAGEFTKEEFARDYVIVEWVEMKDLKYTHNCSILKKTDVGSVVIEDMLGRKFTIHHNGLLADEQIILV